MNAKQPTATKNGITLIRSGVDTQVFDMPEGATLSDLLTEAGASTADQLVTIDGRPLAEHLTLHPGMVVVIAPIARNAASAGSWRDSVGAFADDADFRALVDSVEASREAEKDRS
jgi:hypothetical protein